MPIRSLVLDSSVIAALYFPEPYSDWCEEIVAKYDELYTVDLAYAEVCNVAWKRIKLFGHPENIVLANLDKAIEFLNNVCIVIKTFDEYTTAMDIALSVNIPIYDALFLSLSRRKSAKFATLDKNLVNKLKGSPFKDMVLHPYTRENS